MKLQQTLVAGGYKIYTIKRKKLSVTWKHTILYFKVKIYKLLMKLTTWKP